MKQSSISSCGGVWENALHPWIPEIVLCVILSSLLVAIAVTLASVNGQSQEEWRFTITLNSLINILSTLFRACLATTAAEVISQQKWIWFWSAPPAGWPIFQVHSFEGASQGPWGALMRLPTVLFRQPLTIMPLVIIISSLSIGPFAQQAIGTTYRDMPLGLGKASCGLRAALHTPL